MTEAVYCLQRGTTPLLVSVPHAGTLIPDDLLPRLRERALRVEDSDWHVDTLYAFARELGAGLLVARHSRYLIDLNRPPQDAPLYAGANNTGLCPTRAFTGEPLYRDGQAPGAAEVARRRAIYWQPYHDALAAELERLRAQHGYALLWDGHSIRSELPWLFSGRLPDLNLGSADGASCAASLRGSLERVLNGQSDYSHVTDGRFKGGYITRHYGRPREQVHAVQLELSWACYLCAEAPPFEIDPVRAARLQPLLRALLQAALDWRPL